MSAPPPPIERTNYFTGESLQTDDFQVEQGYQMRMLRLHNRDLHTWGIAHGLEVGWRREEGTLRVAPGMAVDGHGRQIVLLEPQTIDLRGRPRAVYYLTISYDEFPSDYDDATGAAGYKRTVEQPRLELRTADTHPDLHILLAIVDVGASGEIRALDYADGQSARRHCGLRVGEVQFDLPGAGAFTPTLAARQDLVTRDRWLAVEAPSTRVSGRLTTGGALGVGVLATEADLCVQAVRCAGQGTVSSAGQVVTHDGGPFADLPAVGDLLDAEDAPGGPVQARRVDAVLDPGRVQVTRAFDPPLAAAAFWTRHGAIASVRDAAGAAALTVSAEGRVGVRVSEPRVELQVDGTVEATTFIGDGSRLKNVTGLWSRSPDSPDNIYYDEGHVGIGVRDPGASLTVQGGERFRGSGILSNKQGEAKVIGDDDTRFQAEVAAGDILVVGDFPGDVSGKIPLQKRLVVSVEGDQSLTTDAPFDPPLTDAKYSVIGPIAEMTYEAAANPSLVVKPERVGVNMGLPLYTLDVNGDIHASGDLVVSGLDVLGDIQCSTLEASQSLAVGSGAAQAQIKGGQLTAAGVQAGSLAGSSLAVAKSVQMLGGAFGAGSSGTAATDGLLMGFVYPPDNDHRTVKCWGSLSAGRSDGFAASAVGGNYWMASNVWAPLYGTVTVPVRQGQSWWVSTSTWGGNDVNPTFAWYWLPLGTQAMLEGVPAPDLPPMPEMGRPAVGPAQD